MKADKTKRIAHNTSSMCDIYTVKSISSVLTHRTTHKPVKKAIDFAISIWSTDRNRSGIIVHNPSPTIAFKG